ncbi:MAG: hypothetical protein P1U40_06270 [Coxiellaceae bacterium]|nr:hypothetical protein [Coxiellaceae bacterium]
MRHDPYTTVKAQLGILAGMFGNLTGAPFDRVRLDVVADKHFTHSVTTHFRNGLTQGVSQMYLGSAGRGVQKASVALCVAVTPDQYKQSHPLLSASFAGAIAAWLGNIGRIGQINKLKGISYPNTYMHMLTHKMQLLKSTAQFSASESIRAGVCFGTANWLQQQFGEVDSYRQQTINATKTSFVVSGVETSFSWFLETLSVHTSAIQKEATNSSLRQLLRPRYVLRTSGTQMIKNVAANWPLITTLFLGKHLIKQLEQEDADDTTRISNTNKPLGLFGAVFKHSKVLPKTTASPEASKPTP